jgi:hypothetical protein
MIRQVFDIEDYWKVIVYYDLDYSLLESVVTVLRHIGISEDALEELIDKLRSGEAKAATYSSPEKHISVVLFNEHSTNEDYLNSIIHEAEHVKQAMLEEYKVEDKGELPAYTIGYLVGCMYRAFKQLICNCMAS